MVAGRRHHRHSGWIRHGGFDSLMARDSTVACRSSSGTSDSVIAGIRRPTIKADSDIAVIRARTVTSAGVRGLSERQTSREQEMGSLALTVQHELD